MAFGPADNSSKFRHHSTRILLTLDLPAVLWDSLSQGSSVIPKD